MFLVLFCSGRVAGVRVFGRLVVEVVLVFLSRESVW